MSKRMLQRGFTLIELLVVIAIIGILAATVLASLGKARSSAVDAKIKQQLSSLRAQAEVFSNNHSGSYTNLCTDSGTTALTGKINGTTNAFCHSSGSAWAAEAKMSNNHYWCSDSKGVSKDRGTTALGTSATSCG